MNNWKLTLEQIENLAPKATAFVAGKKLSNTQKWESYAKSSRALWGLIKGSGKKPYATQIDIQDLAFKCSCPSRQFPCKHALALLILNTQENLAELTEEPEWVSEWLNKRRNKSAPKVEKEKTPEEVEKSEASKVKRQEERMALVNHGVIELERWLEDLLRGGLLNLPNQPHSFFDDMAARMVDAKAGGLAGWIKSMAKLDYGNIETWHHQALHIIGKINLLIQSWKNYEQLSAEWQITLKNLLGWSQSSKELIKDSNAISIKDRWLVLGLEKEKIEDITVLRSWLLGVENNKKCLVLNFGTVHSPLENNLIAGSSMEAEIAYFPSITPQRGIVKMVKNNNAVPAPSIQFLADFRAMMDEYNALCQRNPWYNNSVHMIENCRLITLEEKWHLVDQQNNILPLVHSFSQEQCMQWILLTGNKACHIAAVLKSDRLLPLGVFAGEKYCSL